MKRTALACDLEKPASSRLGGGWKFALCVLTLWVFFGSAEAQSLKKIRLAIPAFTITAASCLIPQDKGYWREEGLNVETVLIRAAPSILALSAGEVEFVCVGGGALLGILQGLPLRMLFAPFSRPLYAVYARPDIKSFQNLERKKVGVSSLGSGPDSLLRDLFKKRMADEGKSVTILAVGGGSERYIALKTGNVDAAILAPPFTLMARDDGFRELFSFMRGQEYADVTNATVGREELVRSNPELVERFIRGQMKALFFMRRNKEHTAFLLAQRLKVAPEIATRSYGEVLPSLTDDGTINESEQRKSIEYLIDRLNLRQPPRLENIYDFSISRKTYKELQARGWKPSD